MSARRKSGVGVAPTVDAPMPLITVDQHGKFVVGHEALNLLRQIKGDIAVVAVAGLYRTGKSYILNRLLGKQAGFAVGPTVNPCTKGIYMWGKPIQLGRQDQEPLNLLLVDTEGIGSIQQDQTYDVKIFSLAILLSSYFVYNSMSIIDERALDGLSLVVNLTQQITAKSAASGTKANGGGRKANKTLEGAADPSELAEYFPHFLWLLRDFALDLVDDRGAPITSRQYLESALRERPEAAQQSKNGIRQAIKQLFRERDCVTLVRPVVDEKQLKTIDAIPYNNLRAEFREQSDELVQKIFDEAPVKQINGQNLTGDSFAKLIQIYTEAINTGAVASIQSAWDSLSTQVNQSALDEAFHAWTSGINARYNPNRPLGDDQLQALHMECMNEAFSIYDAMAYSGGNSSLLRKTLKQKLLKEYDHLVASNREASTKFVLRLLTSLYEPLEAQVKAGDLKSMEMLLDAWSTLKKNYFESLGDAQASKVVAYEEFIKFYTTNLSVTTNYVMKIVYNTHLAEIDKLKKALEALTAEKHASELAAVKAVEEAKRLNAQLASAEKRTKELEADVVRANVELKESKTAVKELQKQIMTLQGQINTMQTSMSSIQDKLTTTTAEAAKSAKEASKLRSDLNAREVIIQSLESKLAQETQKSAEESKKLAADVKKATEESKRWMASLKEEKAKLEDFAARTKQDLEATVASKEAEKSKADKSQAVLKKEAEEAKKTIAALERRLRDAEQSAQEASLAAQEAQQSLASSAAKHKAELQKLTESESKQKSAQAASERTQVTTLQAQLAKLQTLVGTTVRERDAEKADKDVVQAELESFHEQHLVEVASLNAKLEDHASEIATLKAELQEAAKQAQRAAQHNKSNGPAPAPAAVQYVAPKPAPPVAKSATAKSTTAKAATTTTKAATPKKSGRASIAPAAEVQVHMEADDAEFVDTDMQSVEHMDEDAPAVVEFDMSSSDEEEEEAIPVKKPAKKSVAAKASSSSSSAKLSASTPTKKAAKQTTVAKVVAAAEESESEEEEEVRVPAKVAKAPKTKKATTAAKKVSLSAMDIDELPAAPSRKRARPGNFSETAEVDGGGTPSKRQANDPTKMDKAALKSALTAAGVKLPPGDNAKTFYINLYNKHLIK